MYLGGCGVVLHGPSDAKLGASRASLCLRCRVSALAVVSDTPRISLRTDVCVSCGGEFQQERKRGRPAVRCPDCRCSGERVVRLTLVPPLPPAPEFSPVPGVVYPTSPFFSLGHGIRLIRLGETLEMTCHRIISAGHAYTSKVVDAKRFQSENDRQRILRQARVDERVERDVQFGRLAGFRAASALLEGMAR